jgi:hypothetical protein
MAGQFGLRSQLPRKSQGSLPCLKSATWDRRIYFPSEGRHAVDFFHSLYLLSTTEFVEPPQTRFLGTALVPLQVGTY